MLFKIRGSQKPSRYSAYIASLSKELRLEMQSLKTDIPNIDIPNYPVQVHITDGIGAKCDVEFRRVGSEIHIAISPIFSLHLYKGLWLSLIANYFWFANCSSDVRVMLANVSDGERPSLAPFAASTYSKKVTMLPDHHFFLSRGYQTVDDLLSKNTQDWSERSDNIVWRGSAFGNGYLNFDVEMAEHPMLIQRIRLAQKTKGSEVDFRFVAHELTQLYHFPMHQAGLMGQRVEEFSWVNRKYAIDIDGFSNAWSNFYIRLKLGCCVLKVGVGPQDNNLSGRLPNAGYIEIAPANHYTFLVECSEIASQILAEVGEDPICDDPEGTDRAAVHAKITADISGSLNSDPCAQVLQFAQILVFKSPKRGCTNPRGPFLCPAPIKTQTNS